jgi:RNA polymerase sigma factor (sigma-70 family)
MSARPFSAVCGNLMATMSLSSFKKPPSPCSRKWTNKTKRRASRESGADARALQNLAVFRTCALNAKRLGVRNAVPLLIFYMSDAGQNETTVQPSPAFTTTNWSVVLEAGRIDSPRARAALEKLCQRYWYPLYAFVRRRGHDPHEAKDLTQSFFVHLLTHDALTGLDRSKGLFRSFLLTVLTHFLNDEWDRQKAAKRGGGRQIVSWDNLSAEEMYQNEPAESSSPENSFDRQWAFTLVRYALLQLRKEYVAEGKEELFAQLEPCLTGAIRPGFYAEAAERLKMAPGAVRVALHRLRRRLGQVLRIEVARTVRRPEDVEEEIRCLFGSSN